MIYSKHWDSRFLCAFLKERCQGEVLYIPNPGNAGDALIAAATYQVLDDLGINYLIKRHKDDMESDVSGRVVIYGGGGNLIAQSKK